MSLDILMIQKKLNSNRIDHKMNLIIERIRLSIKIVDDLLFYKPLAVH